jgi:hypothetical protein
MTKTNKQNKLKHDLIEDYFKCSADGRGARLGAIATPS